MRDSDRITGNSCVAAGRCVRYSHRHLVAKSFAPQCAWNVRIAPSWIAVLKEQDTHRIFDAPWLRQIGDIHRNRGPRRHRHPAFDGCPKEGVRELGACALPCAPPRASSRANISRANPRGDEITEELDTHRFPITQLKKK